MYTTFFAILSLVYFVLEHPDKPGSAEILADANDGNNALKSLAKRSQAADRCSIALRVSERYKTDQTVLVLTAGRGFSSSCLKDLGKAALQCQRSKESALLHRLTLSHSRICTVLERLSNL